MENGHVAIAQNCVYLTVPVYPPRLTHIHKKCMLGIPKLSLLGAIGCLSKFFHGALGQNKYLIIPLIRSLGPNNVIVVVCTMSYRCCSVSFIHLHYLMVPSWVHCPAKLCLSTQCGDHQYLDVCTIRGSGPQNGILGHLIFYITSLCVFCHHSYCFCLHLVD